MSTKPRDHLDPTRLENSVTRESKDLSSTESELEEVAERSPSPRESFTVNPSTKVSINSNPRDPTDVSPRKELEEGAEISEYSTPIGVVKTEHTNSTKSSLWTLTTRPSPEMLESTGSLHPSINTEKTEVSPPLEPDTED